MIKTAYSAGIAATISADSSQVAGFSMEWVAVMAVEPVAVMLAEWVAALARNTQAIHSRREPR